MGVRGLHSFLKENRQSLCISAQFTSSSTNQHDRTALIVDAWGVIFQLYLDSLPWCSGGEYLRLYRLVRRLIESWRRAGLEPVFVFDGSTPPEKHDTILGRLRQNHKTALLFHTTSVSSRSSPSFSRSSTILPPFVAQTFIHALQTLNVETCFTADGEADGLCVTIANQLHGYVLGNDSDFLILISSPNATNVKGYCPLDMLMWIEGPAIESQEVSEQTSKEDNDGWSEWSFTRPKRAPTPARQSHFLPPANYINPTLVLTAIPPSALRSRLRLPANIMPLLASFAGNDYTPLSYSETFFENSLSPVQRIEKVARIMRETIFAPSSKVGNAGDQAVDLVHKVIRKLVVRETPNDATLQSMVDTIIESTFQYILPPLPEHQDSFPFNQTPQISSSTVVMDEERLVLIDKAKNAYAQLQKKGMGGAVTHAYLYPGRVYLWPILEDPAGPSLRASEALRRVRRKAWSLVEEGCGGLCWPEPTDMEIKAMKEDLDLRELLGVVQEIESALKAESPDLDDLGVSEQEQIDDNNSNSSSDSGSSTPSLPNATPVVAEERADNFDAEGDSDELTALKAIRPRVVKEYTRQGSSQRIVEILVPLPPVSESATLPLCLEPLSTRLRIYLEAFSSNTSQIHALPASLHPLICATRMTILEISERSGPRPDPKLRGGEVMAILKMGIGMFAAWEKEIKVCRPKKDNDEGSWPALGSRQSGIVSQLNAVMLEGLLLAQALLLLPGHSSAGDVLEAGENKEIDGNHKGITHLSPFMFTSGVALHHLLNHQDPPASTGWKWTSAEDDLLERCADAVFDEMDDHVVGRKRDVVAPHTTPVSPEKKVKEKKGHKKKGASETQALGKIGAGRFDLLGGMDL